MPGMNLNQDDVHKDFLELGSRAWTTVWRSRRSDDESSGIYCAFAPISYRARALADPGWDLRVTDARPGFSQSYGGEAIVTTYHRNPYEPVEPLVIQREFYGAIPSSLEIVEEFRLYHNLYWDEANSQFIQPHDDGTSSVAIRMSESEIVMRTKLIRQYQAARRLDFLLFVDSVRFDTPGSALPEKQEWTDDDIRAALYPGDPALMERAFSRYLGTRVMPPPPVERSGVWPYEKEDDYFPEFIIGTDSDGEEVSFTCNPDALADYFGGNPEAPHYLTAVHFRREVLQKYYEKPELYEVRDGYLSCKGLWGIHIDNNATDSVMVFLGDLGRDLPRQERDYWRSFNIAPDIRMSETGFRRAFLGQWAEPAAKDLQFRTRYVLFRQAWRERYGWPLFREPTEADASLLQRLRIPLNESQAEFEQSIRIMTQLLCDAINEAEIQVLLPDKIPDEKGISKLRRWLQQQGYSEVERDIKFLRNLQELRSKVTAHRKSKDYEKVLTKILDTLRGPSAIVSLLDSALLMLDGLQAWAEMGEGSEDTTP